MDKPGLCPQGAAGSMGSTETEAAITGGRSVTRGGPDIGKRVLSGLCLQERPLSQDSGLGYGGGEVVLHPTWAPQ